MVEWTRLCPRVKPLFCACGRLEAHFYPPRSSPYQPLSLTPQNHQTAATSTHHLPTHYDDDKGVNGFEPRASESGRDRELTKHVTDGARVAVATNVAGSGDIRSWKVTVA